MLLITASDDKGDDKSHTEVWTSTDSSTCAAYFLLEPLRTTESSLRMFEILKYNHRIYLQYNPGSYLPTGSVKCTGDKFYFPQEVVEDVLGRQTSELRFVISKLAPISQPLESCKRRNKMFNKMKLSLHLSIVIALLRPSHYNNSNE